MKLNEMLKTRKGQLIFVCILLAASQLFLFSVLGGSFLSKIPDAKRLQQINIELEKLRKDNAEALKERRINANIKKEYQALAAKSWITSHDGNVETALRFRISEVAGKRNFTLNNIGAVRTGRINNDFFYAEIDLSGAGDIGDVIAFIAELRKIEPVLSWRRLDLRPDRRFRVRSGAGSANLAARLNELPPTRLNFNGALRILGYDGPLSVDELKITRPPFNEEPAVEENNKREKTPEVVK